MNRGYEHRRSWTSRWFAAIREHRFDVLLASLLLLMTTAPLLHVVWPLGRPVVAHLIMLLVFGLMLLSAVLAACQEKKEMHVALWLAVPGFLLDAAGVLAGHAGLSVAGHLFETVFLGYTVVLVLRLIFTARSVTLNTIWAALCVYLLLGVLWANVFSLLDTVQPGSFHFSFVEGDQRELMRLGGGNSVYPLYYSFVTMTTLGYGDIVPITVATRMLAAVEALTGQLYLAVLVARLVGLHVSHSAAQREELHAGEDKPL
jgi:hypothetical protein